MKAMRFSWIGLILAPLLVPVIFSATMLILGEGDVLPAFLTVLVVGCSCLMAARYCSSCLACSCSLWSDK
jgi:hypothetical protein